jgi:hypothetical protein
MYRTGAMPRIYQVTGMLSTDIPMQFESLQEYQPHGRAVLSGKLNFLAVI